MRICNLSSGSDGNLTYLECGKTKVLIDDGLSCKETIKRLCLLGVSPVDIDAVLVTHEHTDHIKGIDNLCFKYNIPVYVHEDGLTSLENKLTKYIKLIPFKDNGFEVGSIGVQSFAVPHDVKRCTGYSFYENQKKISIVTDLGHTTTEIIKNLAGSTLVYLEANHDVQTLINNPKYPFQLKQRILGENGHLSNKVSAETIYELLKSGTRQVVLSHLSTENNSPTLAYESVKLALEEHGVIEGTHIKIDVATLSPGAIFKLWYITASINGDFMKAVIFSFILLFSSLGLSGCTLSSNIDTSMDMTPRLISVGDDLSTSEMVEQVKSAVVGISATVDGGYSVGSGVAIASGGYILTNHHVIEGANSVKVYLANNVDSYAKVLYSDSNLDLAILKADVNMPYLDTSPSSNLKVGEDVIAIGTPLTLQFKHTVTKGIVSALNRTLEISNLGGTTTLMQDLIQHDASINPGNSGGPLIDSAGRVVGINTLKASDAEGIAFAIPIEVATSLTGKVIQNVNYTAPKLGIFAYDVELARFAEKTSAKNGLYIEDVQKDSCLYKAGIENGDVILAINDKPMNSMIELRKLLYSLNDGDVITLKVLRNEEVHILRADICC